MNNLNNLSEVYSLLESDALKNKIISIDKNEMIEVKSHLIHKDNYINYYDNVIFNIDNYVSFIKNYLFINPLELKYILELTVDNKLNIGSRFTRRIATAEKVDNAFTLWISFS